jgi:hypothetical protein
LGRNILGINHEAVLWIHFLGDTEKVVEEDKVDLENKVDLGEEVEHSGLLVDAVEVTMVFQTPVG